MRDYSLSNNSLMRINENMILDEDQEVSEDRAACKGCIYLIYGDDCGHGMGPFPSDPPCWEG